MTVLTSNYCDCYFLHFFSHISQRSLYHRNDQPSENSGPFLYLGGGDVSECNNRIITAIYLSEAWQKDVMTITNKVAVFILDAYGYFKLREASNTYLLLAVCQSYPNFFFFYNMDSYWTMFCNFHKKNIVLIVV